MPKKPLQNTEGREPQAMYSKDFDKPHYGVVWNDDEKAVYGYHYPEGIKGHHVKKFRVRTDKGQFDGMLGKALRLHGPTTKAAENLYHRFSGHPRVQHLEYTTRRDQTIIKKDKPLTEGDIIAEAMWISLAEDEL